MQEPVFLGRDRAHLLAHWLATRLALTLLLSTAITMPQVHSFISQTRPLSRYKVLLVDDDAAVLRGLAAALEFDLDVVTCVSGERALSLLEEQEFHAVCCDYSMPGMNGLELFDHVAKSKLPVACLLLTGSMSFIDRGGSADEYVLLKPVDPARLSALLRQLARTVEMKRNAARPNHAPRP